MSIRTDLALESVNLSDNIEGIEKDEVCKEGINVVSIKIKTQSSADKIGRAIGTYITIETDSLTNSSHSDTIHSFLRDELKKLLPKGKSFFVVGVGNPQITPDALGPKVAEKVLATRHISSELANSIGLNGLYSVSVLSPGVLGQTGIEIKEITECAISKIKPSAVIIIDALAARETKRLGNTIQLCNTGISPGSGVGNDRQEISERTIGIPCISIGVPTVVDASTLCFDLTGNEIETQNRMIVTPREIDVLIERCGDLIGHAINCAIQSNIDEETLKYCV